MSFFISLTSLVCIYTKMYTQKLFCLCTVFFLICVFCVYTSGLRLVHIGFFCVYIGLFCAYMCMQVSFVYTVHIRLCFISLVCTYWSILGKYRSYLCVCRFLLCIQFIYIYIYMFIYIYTSLFHLSCVYILVSFGQI